MKRWSLDARSEGQFSHPLVSEPFAHEWEGGEEGRTSDGANVPAHLLWKVVIWEKSQGVLYG